MDKENYLSKNGVVRIGLGNIDDYLNQKCVKKEIIPFSLCTCENDFIYTDPRCVHKTSYCTRMRKKYNLEYERELEKSKNFNFRNFYK